MTLKATTALASARRIPEARALIPLLVTVAAVVGFVIQESRVRGGGDTEAEKA